MAVNINKKNYNHKVYITLIIFILLHYHKTIKKNL
jgi:hypothetical protein